MKNSIITLAIIFIVTLTFTSCGNTSSSAVHPIEKTSVIERYASNGWVKKFYNQNWELVYDTCHYSYYRVAFYKNDTINKDSLVTDYYKSGLKQFEGFLLTEIPTKLNKKCIWYYPNGNIEKVATFVNGELSGQVIQYYDNKQIQNKYTIVKGIIHGKCLSYYENGQIESDKKYNYGKANGLHLSYFLMVKSKLKFLTQMMFYMVVFENIIARERLRPLEVIIKGLKMAHGQHMMNQDIILRKE